jgi:hypothetical protein
MDGGRFWRPWLAGLRLLAYMLDRTLVAVVQGERVDPGFRTCGRGARAKVGRPRYERLVRRVVWGTGLLAAGVWVIPALVAGFRARYLGNGTADIWGHAAGYGWVASALAHGGSPWAPPINHPVGQPWAVVDLPLAALLTPVTLTAGPLAAWHLGLIAIIALGSAGVAAWVGERGDRAAAVLAGLAWAVSPFVRGVVASGVSEALILGLLPWLAVAVKAERRWIAAAIAALVAWTGPYSSLDLLLWLMVIAVDASARRSGVVRALAPAVCGACVGGVLLGVSAIGHPSFHADLDGPVNPGAMWAWASRGGADLANVFAPWLVLPPAEPTVLHRHVAWVGVVAATLMVASVRRAPGERRWWAALVVGAVVLSLGPELRVWGARTGVPLPGALLGPLLGQNPWRHAGLAALIVPMLVGVADRRWLAVVMLEGLLAPAPWWPPSTPDPVGPVERALATGEGAVLDLPLDREGRLPKGIAPQRAFVLGVAHGRPIASALYVAPAVLDNPAVARLDEQFRAALVHDAGWRRPRAPGAPPPRRNEEPFPGFLLPSSARADLARRGFTAVTLAADVVPPSARPAFERALCDWLGEPERRTPDRWLWRL